MKNFLEAKITVETVRILTEMYRHGWDERNGGNLSVLLGEDDIAGFVDTDKIIRSIKMPLSAPSLAGRYFLVTGTGKYFRNAEHYPDDCLGLIRISADGNYAQLLWGFSGGGSFTSELPAHLMSHEVRLRRDSESRVIMHCHPSNLLAMTYVHSLDEREFTRTLWRMCTECIVVFPDGISVLPWMVCGTGEIGTATAAKMESSRLTVWGQHGIYGAGKNLDEAFGLIETAEKAAEIYMMTAHLPTVNTITDDGLRELCDAFGLTPHEGWL